jgi:hypothetical protein
LAGSPAILVALVGSLAVMFVTLVLTNGVGAQTLAAALGIAATLLLTSVLAILASNLAALDGKASELSSTLSAPTPGRSLQGVVVAGIVIGALGVLADTAVTQASAVMALRRANRLLHARELCRRNVPATPPAGGGSTPSMPKTASIPSTLSGPASRPSGGSSKRTPAPFTCTIKRSKRTIVSCKLRRAAGVTKAKISLFRGRQRVATATGRVRAGKVPTLHLKPTQLRYQSRMVITVRKVKGKPLTLKV